MSSTYQQRLGARLRDIRNQQGLTLQQVEEKSQGRWKAVVVGSYERGDRAVSVAKLAELAEFYTVPVSALLPTDDELPSVSHDADGTLVLDLNRLSEDPEPGLTPIARYASTVQVQRGDYNGRVLSLREADLRSLATVLGVEPDELLERLSTRGILTR